MERPDAVAVVSQMTSVYEEPGVAFEFPAFPAVPREMPALALQEGAFSSAAHYGGSMMIRKSACEWGNSLRMTASFEDDLMGFHAWLQGNIYEMLGTSLYYYRFALKIFAPSTARSGLPTCGRRRPLKKGAGNEKPVEKSKEAGLELCGELLEGLAPVFRSREELLAEMEERRK